MNKTKFCTKCKHEKFLDDFSAHKGRKDGKDSWCKNCCKIIRKEFYRRNPWLIIFDHIKQRCNNPKCKAFKWYGGRGIKCLITIEEIKKLWLRDKAKLLKRPSIDRKDNDGNYTLKNCRFIELHDNIIRQDKSPREKAINQYDLNNGFIKSWKSIMEIQRTLGFNQGHISQVCTGKRKTANKFIWKFVKRR